MKIGEMQFDIANVGKIEARDVELTTDEFLNLVGLIKLMNDAQVELEKLRSKDRP